jgi:hypothetical protein
MSIMFGTEKKRRPEAPRFHPPREVVDFFTPSGVDASAGPSREATSDCKRCQVAQKMVQTIGKRCPPRYAGSKRRRRSNRTAFGRAG